MKKNNQKIIILVFMFIIIVQLSIISQESYDAFKTGTKPKIGEGIDEIWSKVKMVPVNKPVDDGNRTTEHTPPAADYSMEWGMMWDKDGLYFLIKIVDDKLVREFYDDPISDWHKDDCFNFLISYNFKFDSSSPLEFAWLVTNETEAKARSRFGFPGEQIKIGWTVKDNTYYAEVFLGWKGFQKVFEKKGKLKAGDKLPIEVRGRDDDGGGVNDYPQTFYHWSDGKKSIEITGLNMGSVLLSKEEIK